MPFHADIRQFHTADRFAAHLAAHPPIPSLWGSWRDTQSGQVMRWHGGAPSGVTLHHTEKPTPDGWHGRRTMNALQSFYHYVKGWEAAPHLFVVTGSPDSANDGIWQLTPLNLVGIHAGVCNTRQFGMEVVGNYNRAEWPLPLRRLVVDTLAALFRWMGWREATPETLRGHRDCGSPKSCPGSMIGMVEVRSWVQAELRSV